MKNFARPFVFASVFLATALAMIVVPRLVAVAQEKSPVDGQNPGEKGNHVAVVFSEGYETDRRDGGRPVMLIAAALGVSSDVFREAFSGVKPATGGRGPSEQEARQNKSALMKVLKPLGITNDRLDTVSNYYRYNRGRGETWRHTAAEAYATVVDGKITEFTIKNAGSGYSSAPKISVPGFENVAAEATLNFGTDFKTNGSIKEIQVVKPKIAE